MWDLVFLGTLHKGARLTVFGKMMSLLGYWKSSSTSLLEVAELKSTSNQTLHEDFMTFLRGACSTTNTLCVFEAIKESLFSIPIMHVGAYLP